MMNSIHTNVGAIVALQGMNRTNMELDAVQKKVNTGYRVNDAKDDGASFAIAQNLRGNMNAYDSVNEQIAKAKGLLTVGLEAARAISDTLNDLEGLIVKLADANVVGNQRTQYASDFQALTGEITNFIANANFQGQNLLTAGAAISVVVSIDGATTIDITQFDGAAQITGATGLNTLTAPATAAANAALLAAAGGAGTLTDAKNNIGTIMSTMGQEVRRMDNQANYISVLRDATEEGIGSIVDADLAKESARLQSLQIRQQLGVQSLGIANQAPQILLNLFG